MRKSEWTPSTPMEWFRLIVHATVYFVWWGGLILCVLFLLLTVLGMTFVW